MAEKYATKLFKFINVLPPVHSTLTIATDTAAMLKFYKSLLNKVLKLLPAEKKNFFLVKLY